MPLDTMEIAARTLPTTASPKRIRPASIAGHAHMIRAEFLEMPGLHLTGAQARRLWNLDPMTCDAILGALVDSGFLRRTPTGAYALAGDPR